MSKNPLQESLGVKLFSTLDNLKSFNERASPVELDDGEDDLQTKYDKLKIEFERLQ